MTTEDKQRIVFEHGAVLTGDSGERGDAVTPDGGVESIKPLNDGERAHQTVFRRPEENMRKRSEALRDAGEQQKYLEDQMKWIMTQGRVDGKALGPEELLSQIEWNSGTGIFVTSENIVLQPLNTPDVDKQETVSFSFTDGIPNTANVDFDPVSGVDGKRAYNGANLMEVIWEEAATGDMGSALVPGQCDMVISGDPVHILTITIRNDAQTQMSDVQTALSILGAPALAAMGLVSSIGGTLSTYLDYVTITDPDFVFTGNFDREVHYIEPAAFAAFFAIPKSLADGDTLAIEWTYYVQDGDINGRRQRIPANIGAGYPDHTTVFPGQLFISSENPERIPFSIPLCKRIGKDLFWLDGTVSLGLVGAGPVIYMGEHGYTVQRIIDLPDDIDLNITSGWFTTNPTSWGPTATVNSAINGILDDLARATTGGGAVEIGKSVHPDPGGSGWSQEPVWKPLPAESVGEWLETLLIEVNKCARVATGEYISGTRWYRESNIFEFTEDDWGTPGTYSIYYSTVHNVKTPSFIDDTPPKYANGNPDTYITRKFKYNRGDSVEYYRNGPVSGFYTYNNVVTPGELKANELKIGSGVAWVGGHQLFSEGFILEDVWNGTADGGFTDASKTTMVGQSHLDVGYAVYVWLRVDGTVWLDIHGPKISTLGEHWRSRTGGYYYPHSDSGLPHADYDEEDYALIDVCWVAQGNTDETPPLTAIRLAGFIPMGGGFRAFQNAKFYTEPEAVPTWTQMHHQIYVITESTTAIIVPTNYVHGTNKYLKCPGLPVVSNLAKMSISGIGAVTGTTRTVISLGFAATDFPDVHNAFPEQYGSSPGALPTVSLFGPSITIRDGDTDYGQDSGDVYYFKSYNDYRTQVGVSVDPYSGSVGGTLTYTVHVQGFWWDKFSGPMVSHFQEKAPV